MKNPDVFFAKNDPRDFVTMLKTELHMDIHTLQQISGIDQAVIEQYSNKDGACDWGELKQRDNRTDFEHLLGLLTVGMFACDEDSRLQAVLEALLTKYAISLKTISIYAGVSEVDIANFFTDHHTMSSETKYKLAVPVLFLYYICK